MSVKRTDDYYSRMAKEQGYPARSVFKLAELQKRFRLIKGGVRILDLGAAPGSWSLYCLRLLAGSGKVVGVDITEFKLKADKGLLGNYHFIKGDIFDPEVERMILEQGPYDLLLSDAAPATTGQRAVDAQASLNIAWRTLELAGHALVCGGSLVVKVFQGGEEGKLLAALRGRFAKARALKPAASRKSSKETFFLGFGCR